VQVLRGKATDAWQDPELIFTSAYGTPYEPWNFNRQLAVRCQKAGVLYIRVHDTRRTRAPLLVALDVHPGRPCRSSSQPHHAAGRASRPAHMRRAAGHVTPSRVQELARLTNLTAGEGRRGVPPLALAGSLL